MDMEVQIEPIVSKAEIWERAKDAAEKQLCIHESNPFPEGMQAHSTYQLFYWQRERELNGETYS